MTGTDNPSLKKKKQRERKMFDFNIFFISIQAKCLASPTRIHKAGVYFVQGAGKLRVLHFG